MQEPGQAVDVLPMDLDQGQRARMAAVDLAMHGFDQRALAHAACTPKQGVVGRASGGEALRVGEQNVANPGDPHQQLEWDGGDSLDRPQAVVLRLPHEGIGGVEVALRRGRRRQSFERLHQAMQERVELRVRHAASLHVPSGRQARSCRSDDQPDPMNCVAMTPV